MVDFRTADATDFLVPGESSGFRLWGNTASGDHSTGSGLTWFGKTENTDALLSVIMRKRGSLYQSDGGHAPNVTVPSLHVGQWMAKVKNKKKFPDKSLCDETVDVTTLKELGIYLGIILIIPSIEIIFTIILLKATIPLGIRFLYPPSLDGNFRIQHL